MMFGVLKLVVVVQILLVFESSNACGRPCLLMSKVIDARLSIEAKEDEAVKHALAVRAAVTSGNYVTFFRLYKAAPNLNTCLMGGYL